MATEDNVEVVSDYPLGDNQTENETLENEEVAEEPESSETEKSKNQKEVETLLAQKEHWRKKYQELEKKSAKVKDETKGDGEDEEFRPRVEFLLENRDLNADEYDHIAAVALRSFGKISLDSLRDAKKSEADYIGYLRKKAESKSKMPGSTSGGSASRMFKTPAEIGKMTREEHMAYEEQLMKAQRSGL